MPWTCARFRQRRRARAWQRDAAAEGNKTPRPRSSVDELHQPFRAARPRRCSSQVRAVVAARPSLGAHKSRPLLGPHLQHREATSPEEAHALEPHACRMVSHSISEMTGALQAIPARIIHLDHVHVRGVESADRAGRGPHCRRPQRMQVLDSG